MKGFNLHDLKGFLLTRFEGLLHTRFEEVSAYKEFPSDEEETGTVMVGWRAVHWRSFDEVPMHDVGCRV